MNNGIPVLTAPGGCGNPIPNQVFAGIQIGGAVERRCLPPDAQARIELLFRAGSGPQSHRGRSG